MASSTDTRTSDVATSEQTPLLPELATLRRPRLRDTAPVLWRDGTTIAIGERARLDHVSRAEAAWLSSLDGGRTAAQIEAELPIDVGRARRLLRAAIAGAGLDDASSLPDPIRWARPEDRPTPWGRFGAVVESTGSIDASAVTLAARDRSPVHVVGDGLLAGQVRAALGWAGLPAADPGGRTASPATFTVVAVERPVDLAPVDEAPPAGPHVRVAVWGRRATVGPVTGPGLLACTRCHQLHLRDKDPAWPLLAVQWMHASQAVAWPPIDPLLSGLAAVVAARVVRDWVDDPQPVPEPWAVEIDLPSLEPARVPRPTHPLCGCRWTQDRR